MSQPGFPLLSLLLWLPALGALAILLTPPNRPRLHFAIALAASAASFVLVLAAFVLFDRGQPGYQFAEQFQWIPAWGISYSLAVDGISLPILLMGTFIAPIAVLATWNTLPANSRTFQILLLLLDSGMIGVLLARDIFLFYVFFEFTLIPLALLVGIFGGAGRVEAATKFFVYTFSASILMLLGMIGVYILHGQQTGSYTADYPTLLASVQSGAFKLDMPTAAILFTLFFVGLAVKTPLWPFHTWLPPLHTEAPASGAVDLAIMLLKFGPYGMIRFNLGFFPEIAAWFAPAVGVLAAIGIVYAAVVACGQNDLKRILAYSSVSHLNVVVLGIFALNAVGISGGVAQIVNSGLTGSALFLVVAFLYRRRSTHQLRSFGGLWKIMPVLGGLALVAVCGSIGLPGLSGFASEYPIIQGTWLARGLGWRFAVATVIGAILAAVYLLRLFRITFMGELDKPENQNLPDLAPREIVQLGLLIVPIVVFGLVPNLLYGNIAPAAERVAAGLSQVLGVR